MRVRKILIFLLATLQLFRMKFLKESRAGHYKKIGYITLYVYFYVSYMCMLCAKQEKIVVVVMEVLIRNLLNQRLK